MQQHNKAKDIPPEQCEALYAAKPYLDAYAEHTDRRVSIDPHQAIGGNWEEMGRRQFDYLVQQGLQPHHRLLDIGCGTLRGGRHFIRYLDAGNYTGFDISPAAIAYGEQLIDAEGLRDKRPRILLNVDKRLRFSFLAGERFDYLLAQSVFTHLPEDCIAECFANLRRVMGPRSRFYFTFNEAKAMERRSVKNFRYPFAFFEAFAQGQGLSLSRRHDYPHIKKQRMVVVHLTEAALP